MVTQGYWLLAAYGEAPQESEQTVDIARVPLFMSGIAVESRGASLLSSRQGPVESMLGAVGNEG
eukprot:5401008-Amphidinium_carterae.1